MNIRTACGALILGGLLAGTTPSTLSLAQTNEKTVSGTAATGNAAKGMRVNTNTNPIKHRHWRHRGGTHPHYGSRRVRSHIHTPQ